jgi:hypothetical protein
MMGRIMPLLLIALVLGIASCRAQPSARYETGEVLLRETFDRAYDWGRRSQDGVEIGPEAGAYRMRADVNQFVRGFNSTPHTDVVIEAHSSQLSADRHNAYGVMCRATADDASTNGYYFLIGADGSYSIRIGQFGEVRPLVHWSRSGAINRGAATNHIRAVCVEDYLALYVNDEFLADVRDSTHSRGFAGLTVAAREGSSVEIAFNTVTIFEAALAAAR